jgi:gliding motility-associated-like protein
VIEKDNIQELFSKAFENQTASVRPDLWAGVQAKMAAAGVASTATVATKGLSALTKWIIGSAAVGTVGVVTAVVALNSGEEQTTKQTDSPKEISQNVIVTSPEGEKTENETFQPHIGYSVPVVTPEKPTEDVSNNVNSYKEINTDASVVKEHVVAETPKMDKRLEEKTIPTDNSKKDASEKTDSKKAAPVDHKKDDVKEVPSTKQPEDKQQDPVKPENVAKVSKFPNIFTPNGDGDNDYYQVEVENLVDFRMTIMDQSGKTVFQTNDINDKWDGRIGDNEAKSGSYAVFIDGKNPNGKAFHKSEIITLLRR